MDPLTTSLLNLGSTGVLAAVLLYLQQQMRSDMKDNVDKFINTLTAERIAFREELAAERALCHEDHEKILTAIQYTARDGRA